MDSELVCMYCESVCVKYYLFVVIIDYIFK